MGLTNIITKIRTVANLVDSALNLYHKQLHSFGEMFLIALLMLWATPGLADDTEIFAPQGCPAEKYRFIFVVDNSSSMSATEFAQSKATIDSVISTVLSSSLEGVEVAVVQYGTHQWSYHHTYDVTVGFTSDLDTALAWNRIYDYYSFVGLWQYASDHMPASLAAMRGDNVYAPGAALDITDGTNVQFVFFTDAWRILDFCCSSLVAEDTAYFSSSVKSGFGEYNALKDGSVLGGIKAQFTLLHVSPNSMAKAAGAAIASVGGNYSGSVESNSGDPSGSGVTPRRYIEGTLSSTDTDLIVNLVQEVIEEIQTTPEASFTAPAISLDYYSRISHRKDIYFALFSPSGKPNWDGNLKRYEFSGSSVEIRDKNDTAAVDPATGTFYETAQSYWSLLPDGTEVRNGGAAALLTYPNRKVTTYLGMDDRLLATANKLHEDTTAITAEMLGVSDGDRADVLQ